MIALLRRRPAQILQRVPGARADFEIMFRRAITEPVAGVLLHVTDHQLQLDLIGDKGDVVGGALLPRPEIEDLT